MARILLLSHSTPTKKGNPVISIRGGSRRRSMRPMRTVAGLMVLMAGAACSQNTGPDDGGTRTLDPQLVAQGKEIFRFDTFGDEVYWTDTLQMHTVISTGVSPKTALGVGLKVDSDALPEAVKAAIAAGQVDL